MSDKPEDSKPEKPKQRRPTPKEWGRAEAMYAAGEVTAAELARQLGVSKAAVAQHMFKFGVKHGSKAEEHKRKVAEKVGEGLLDDAALVAARIRETKDEHYKMASGLAKLAWSEILKAKQDNVPIATVGPNLKALDSAMNVLVKARTERWAVLGLDKPDADEGDDLPELVISELTAEQVEELRSRDADEISASLEKGPDVEVDLDIVEEGGE